MATAEGLHSNHYGESILYDGCDICEELSKHIYGLRNDQLKALARLATTGTTRGRSINESRAITHFKIYRETIERSKIGESI